MSYTATPRYGLLKPAPGGDEDLWGGHLNQNADLIDAQVAPVASPTFTGNVTSAGTTTLVGATTAQGTTNLQGDVSVGTPTTQAQLSLLGAAGQVRPLRWLTGTVQRWIAGLTGGESTGNAGSDWALQRNADDGTALGTVLSFSRASGLGSVAADPTAALGIATKQYVDAKAPLASPVFSGDPQVPTAAFGDSDTSAASTSFVQQAVSSAQRRVLYYNGTTTPNVGASTGEEAVYVWQLPAGTFKNVGDIIHTQVQVNCLATTDSKNWRFRVGTNASGIGANTVCAAANLAAVGTTTGFLEFWLMKTGPNTQKSWSHIIAATNNVQTGEGNLTLNEAAVCYVSLTFQNSTTAVPACSNAFGLWQELLPVVSTTGSGSAGLAEAPADGQTYGRQGSTTSWLALTIPGASSTLPVIDGTAAAGVGTTYARADHVHPTDTSRYAASNPSGYVNTAAAAAAAPVQSVAGRTGTVTLSHTDITDWTTASVTSFNTRAGAVTLTTTDITDAGAALSSAVPAASTSTPVAPGAGTVGVSAAYARADHQHPTDAPAASSTAPVMDGTATVGVGTTYARADHVHPSDTTRLALTGGAMSGGLTFGSTAAGTPGDVSRHISLYGTTFGLSITASRINYVVPATNTHVFRSGAADRVAISDGGIVMQAGTDVTLVRDPSTALMAATKQYVDNLAGRNVGRNVLHNAMFTVQQRGTGPFSAVGYTFDRWLLQYSLDTSVSVARTVLGDVDRNGIVDEEATYAAQINYTGNAGAGSYTILSQSIENVRRLAGKTVTVSFWASSPQSRKIGVSFDQAFGTGGSPSASVSGTGQSVTTSSSWARYSMTFALASVNGKTFGTNNDSYTSMLLWCSAGATNATRSGTVGVQVGTTTVWGVQCEIAPAATLLERIDARNDLANCQRFYQTGTIQIYGYQAASTLVAGSNLLPVPMRALPTITPSVVGSGNVTGPTAGALSNVSVNASGTATATGAYTLQMNFTASADL